MPFCFVKSAVIWFNDVSFFKDLTSNMPSAKSSLERTSGEDAQKSLITKEVGELSPPFRSEEFQPVPCVSPTSDCGATNRRQNRIIPISDCDNDIQSQSQNQLLHPNQQLIDPKHNHNLFLDLTSKVPWKHPLVIAKPDVQVRPGVGEVWREGKKGIGITYEDWHSLEANRRQMADIKLMC